jgi:hypothetical protein
VRSSPDPRRAAIAVIGTDLLHLTMIALLWRKGA